MKVVTFVVWTVWGLTKKNFTTQVKKKNFTCEKKKMFHSVRTWSTYI